ncbi:MAG: hypothetical protein ABR977_10560 [Candidatus Dormibacteria bacterium]
MAEVQLLDFDGRRLFAALDAQRTARGLSWRAANDEIWEMSAALNRRRQDHPISLSTILNLREQGRTSCAHGLFMLRWLGLPPESFLRPAPERALKGEPRVPADVGLPAAGEDERLRWDLREMYEALDARRRERALTWPELARALRCTPGQLTGLRTARFTAEMNVAMRAVQWLERPAADFIHPAQW